MILGTYKRRAVPYLTGEKPNGFLPVHGMQIPFVTMGNEPESTDPAVLEPRFASVTHRLMAGGHRIPSAAIEEVRRFLEGDTGR